MEKEGVISPVTELTDWCAPMVVVPKKNNAVRICVDFTHLNKSVCRERHILPAVDENLAKFPHAKYFTCLDACSGFWQIPLSSESRLLTTFISPIGRFCFNRFPFGISSAPEHFQRRMSQVLDSLPGVVWHMDDILVYGATEHEHDSRLTAVLQRLQDAGITLNADKCQFSEERVTFLGHVVDRHGVHAGPEKLRAQWRSCSMAARGGP